jgi:hypothetical protein
MSTNINRLVFKITGHKFRALAETTSKPEILLALVKAGYNNWEVIAVNAARFNLIDLVTGCLIRVQDYWEAVRNLNNFILIDAYNREFYKKIVPYIAEGGNINLVRGLMELGADNYLDIATSAAVDTLI